MTIVEKWTRTGLLKGLDKEDAKNLAEKLDALSTEIQDRYATPALRVLSDMILPIQRRVHKHKIAIVGDDIQVNDVKYSSVIEFASRLKHVTQGWNDLTAEVELCNVLSDEIEQFATAQS